MTSGEDYLDNLLAAAMQKEETMGVTMPEKASEEVLTDETTVAASVEETTVAAQVEETPITETPITEEQEADADANIEQEADELMALLMGADKESKTETETETETETDIDIDIEEPDIEEQLAQAAKVDEPSKSVVFEEEKDLSELLDEVDGDEELTDISDLLKKAENNELVEESLLEQPEGIDVSELSDYEQAGVTEEGVPEDVGAQEEEKPKKSKWKKKTKKEKESENEENSEKEKKPSFFTKLFHALTVEEGEADKPNNTVPEQEATMLSDENLSILSAIDAEKKDNSKEDPQEGKKKKDKKEKKPKNEKKEKKQKKPKKTKEKLAPMPDDTKKIPKKYVVRTFLLSFSVLAAILVIVLLLPNLLLMKDARDAYYQQNYKEAFLSLYGKELNESDQLIYDRAKLIVLMERKYESFENYMNMGMDIEALNALLQGLDRYALLSERANELGVSTDLEQIKNRIIEALQEEFGLSVADANEILSYDALDYTNCIESIVNKTPFVKAADEINAQYGVISNQEEDTAISDNSVPEELPDLLPEEEEYLNQDMEVEIQIESNQF